MWSEEELRIEIFLVVDAFRRMERVMETTGRTRRGNQRTRDRWGLNSLYRSVGLLRGYVVCKNISGTRCREGVSEAY